MLQSVRQRQLLAPQAKRIRYRSVEHVLGFEERLQLWHQFLSQTVSLTGLKLVLTEPKGEKRKVVIWPI
jgi:hypothetical protein